nr:immunoglobulin light chain junction region [Macaca mulatta]MOW12812.1 immunoglobulin light chain junction region [Macaca mulatta]MOW34933.1 immunoglobulin light chain junction region [Macaca mulatta]MOW51426.1 immunoglobulin light chain junction region [Macaca mulatta]MOW51428.1 immunoglobulin light chain junction region [Macaca mulatta]
CMQVLEFPWTF